MIQNRLIYHPLRQEVDNFVRNNLLGELSFEGKWTLKLTKGPYKSSNWVEGYEIVTDKYTL